MKWFSISGIVQEIKKIRWPKKSELVKDSTTAVVFMFIFGIFFIVCDFVVAGLLRLLEIGV